MFAVNICICIVYVCTVLYQMVWVKKFACLFIIKREIYYSLKYFYSTRTPMKYIRNDTDFCLKLVSFWIMFYPLKSLDKMTVWQKRKKHMFFSVCFVFEESSYVYMCAFYMFCLGTQNIYDVDGTCRWNNTGLTHWNWGKNPAHHIPWIFSLMLTFVAHFLQVFC